MGKVRLGIVGVGNCASSLLQGLEYYRDGEGPKQGSGGGLMHLDLGGYRPGDIQVVCAFDIDERKAGKPLEVAALAPPNCTQQIYPKLPNYKIRVEMGPLLDGFSQDMVQYPPEQRFVPSDVPAVDVAQV